MFKTIDELKDFILWAKKNEIGGFKIGDCELSFNQESQVPDATKQLIDKHLQLINSDKANDISLDNPFLFDAAGR